MNLKSLVSLVLCSLPLTAQGWVDRTTSNGPAPRSFPSLCYDPAHGYVIMAGGFSNSNVWLPDTWTWDGVAWTARSSVPTGGSYQGGFQLQSMAFDPATGSVILCAFGQAFSWDGNSWQALGSSPGGPGWNCNMAYDATRNEIVYYDALTLQVSTWNGTAWNTRVPPTVPISTTTTLVAWRLIRRPGESLWLE